MDIICPKCGEPFENEEMHYHADSAGMTYDEVWREVRRHGCGVMGFECNAPVSESERNRVALASEIADLLGGDTDGYWSMMDDAEFLGYI